jgi:hypothetical protein
MLCRVLLRRKHIARGRNLTGFYSTLLLYVIMREKANIKRVELVGKHTICMIAKTLVIQEKNKFRTSGDIL